MEQEQEMCRKCGLENPSTGLSVYGTCWSCMTDQEKELEATLNYIKRREEERE